MEGIACGLGVASKTSAVPGGGSVWGRGDAVSEFSALLTIQS